MKWFSADPHYDHKNIITLSHRPFVNVDDMNETLIERWNSKVGSDDDVDLLGDVWTTKYIHRLKGHITVICGNHDAPWLGRGKGTESRNNSIKKYRDAGFDRVIPKGIMQNQQCGPHRVDESHFPYVGDSHDEDRFTEWRPIDYGRTLLCGHVHHRWREQQSPKGTWQINVGVDVWDYYPVSAQEVATLIDRLKGNVT